MRRVCKRERGRGKGKGKGKAMTPKLRARRAANAVNMGLDEQPVQKLDWIGENKTHSLKKGNRGVDRDHAPTRKRRTDTRFWMFTAQETNDVRGHKYLRGEDMHDDPRVTAVNRSRKNFDVRRDPITA
jgi:hypothetical protein